jgi:hypothetical protein
MAVGGGEDYALFRVRLYVKAVEVIAHVLLGYKCG